MKWSTPLPIGSTGMRVTGDQLVPSVDVLKTRSLVVQPGSKRQSGHVT
jgi:hypothetical protein